MSYKLMRYVFCEEPFYNFLRRSKAQNLFNLKTLKDLICGNPIGPPLQKNEYFRPRYIFLSNHTRTKIPSVICLLQGEKRKNDQKSTVGNC